MANSKKIIELLTKENLTPEEKENLLDLLNTNPDAGQYNNLINIINNLAGNEHLSTDELSNYVLYLNEDSSAGNEFAKSIPSIEKHLSSCSKCQQVFSILNKEFNDIDNFVSSQIQQSEGKSSISEISDKTISWYKYPSVKYYLTSLFAVVMIYISLFAISEFTTPSYIRISQQNQTTEYSTKRGRNSEYFQNGIEAIEKGNYSSAISSLTNDVIKNPKDETIFYTYYVLGIAYLEKSETSFLGLFPSYNHNDLKNAIAVFNKTIESNNSGLFNNINNNTFYFLGKAYLLYNDIPDAEKYLHRAVSNKSDYSRQAGELLTSIK